jgi:Zn-finger nucleic acid-binding protein
METVRFGDVEIDRCTVCHGLWFDMLEREDLKALSGSEVIDSGSADVGMAQDRQQRIACPVCRVPMIAMVVSGQAHISYEACTVCYGVYFDAGEFTDYREETLRERMNALFARH